MSSQTSWSGWPVSPPQNLPQDAPLWRRTQRRLQRMATFSAQHTSFEDGSDPVIEAMESAITQQSRLLVLLLKRWEDSQMTTSEPIDRVSKLGQSVSAAPSGAAPTRDTASPPMGEP